MPKDLDRIKTGIKSLDVDLRELFTICDDKNKLSNIKKAIANKNVSSEEFSKIVPESLIRLSIYLTGSQFAIALEKINKEAVDLVKKAKSLIEKHFANLFENKIAKSILTKKVTEEGEHVESLTDEVIRGFGYYFMWENDPPELQPAVRLSLKNRKRKILLNTRLDWEDLSLFLKNVSEIFVELLEKGKTLTELGQIDLSDSQQVLKNIEETLENLQKMKEIMPVYKSKTKAVKKKKSLETS
jgi:hypothetical protein